MYNVNDNKAFSLIELMVVIAIVALIAAVAAPAYQSYIKKTKYEVAANAFFGLSEQLVHYYNKKNAFPSSVAEIGLSPSISNPTQTAVPASVAEFLIPPYVAQFSLMGGSAQLPGSCGFFGVQVLVDNIEAPFTGCGANTVSIQKLVIDVNGVLKTFCITDGYQSALTFDPQIGDCPDINSAAGQAVVTAFQAAANSC